MNHEAFDGKAVVGQLGQALAGGLTSATVTCGSCGAREALESVHGYQGAGAVLRCPQCEEVLVKVVEAGTRVWMGFTSAVTIEVPTATSPVSPTGASSGLPSTTGCTTG